MSEWLSQRVSGTPVLLWVCHSVVERFGQCLRVMCRQLMCGAKLRVTRQAGEVSSVLRADPSFSMATC
eukprot:3452233-Amphidinium_carterae.1